jgi:hypothetical protein
MRHGNYGSNSVSLYNIAGRPTFVTTATGERNPHPRPQSGRHIRPCGNYGDGSVWEYSVSAVDGSLTFFGMAAAGSGRMACRDPSGRFVYVPNNETRFRNTASTQAASLTPIAGAVNSGSRNLVHHTRRRRQKRLRCQPHHRDRYALHHRRDRCADTFEFQARSLTSLAIDPWAASRT